MPKIARVGLLVLITGLLATIVYSRRNERALWIPASADLPISQGQSTEVGFTATEDGFCELEIAADDNIERDGRRLIMATGEESSLDIDWEVRLDGETIASGDSRAYLYVQGGPPSLTGRLRRIGMRDPFGQNEKCWRSFGLLGATTISRGIGRFSVRAGQRYTVSASAADDFDSLRAATPKLLVRLERRRWEAHYASTRALGYLGLGASAIGAALVMLGLIQKPLTCRFHELFRNASRR